jgi:hypothetical protein
MPLMKIHVTKGIWSSNERDLLLEVVHETMVECFRVPADDRYQILHEHEGASFRALDTGLGFQRTERFVLLEVVTRPRAPADKARFYQELCRVLGERCNLAPTDLMVSCTINSDEDWSFGMGEAQFLTGKL